MVEGEWAGRVTGMGSQYVEIAMMVTPDGHSRLELSQFISPSTIADHSTSPANPLGYLSVMFSVDNLEEMVNRLRSKGYELIGEIVLYEHAYKLCYVRGVEGLLIGLGQAMKN